MDTFDTTEMLAAIAAGTAAIVLIANASTLTEIGLKMWKKLRRAA